MINNINYNKMKKGLLIILLAGFLFNAKSQDLPITAFWWNGGWGHYDPELIQYLDEIIIFAIAPNPDTGALLEYSRDEETGVITYIKGKTNPGLTTTMVDSIVKTAKEHNVRLTLGINGMGRKDKYFNALIDNGYSDIFADSVLSFLKRHNMDGVDVDYEHPDDDYDIANLATLFTALRNKLHPEGMHVSGAFGGTREATRKFLIQHHDLLDQINIMGYLNPVNKYTENLEYLVANGVPKEKLFGGHGFYYADKPNKRNFDYREIVELVDEDVTQLDIVYMADTADASVTLELKNYNSDETMKTKLDWIRDNGYGGVMVWGIQHDLPAADERCRIKYMHSIAKQSVTSSRTETENLQVKAWSTNNKLILENTSASLLGKGQLNVFSTDGKLLMNKCIDLSSGSVTLNHNLKEGVYLVRGLMGNGAFAYKLMVD